jgi:hypothetical protein
MKVYWLRGARARVENFLKKKISSIKAVEAV